MEDLKKWKASKYRKPLLLRGARQVGKTWLMKEFGKSEYDRFIYINLDHNPQMQNLFSQDFDINRILKGIEIYTEQTITENTLIIFDEIQEIPAALASLKYFSENAPQYHILCAGSLLGVALHGGSSFPVGKVDFLELFPMTFAEFLLAMGKEQYFKLLQSQDFDMANHFAPDLISLLRDYYFVGGMPEAVRVFSETKDYGAVRSFQKKILDAYEQDFSKHAPVEVVPRIRLIWNSIPSQLSKENKKFIYGLLREGARAKEYENALMWLSDCGLIHRVYRVTVPKLPLKVYEDLKAFKIYLLDVGLLGCLAGTDKEMILNKNALFVEFKSSLTEQYVLQEMRANGIAPYYWTNEKGSAEIDFLISSGREPVPIEVKAEVNLKSKSLRVYHEKFEPQYSVRTSMQGYQTAGWLLNIPLWAIGSTKFE